MEHPNQASMNALRTALLIQHVDDHLGAPAAYARQTAEYIAQSEAHTPDPDEVEAGMRLFLALRMAWNPGRQEDSAGHETMQALQDTLLALGYDMDLDGAEFDLHTPDAEGALDMLGEEVTEQLETSGFSEDADFGLIVAAMWHAIAHHMVADVFEETDPLRLVRRHALLCRQLITRIYTGSFDLRVRTLGDLVREARGLVLDMASLPDSSMLVALSATIRDTFGVADEAGGIDSQALPGAPLPLDHHVSEQAMSHASATLAAVAGSTKEIAWATLTTMLMGSRTGIPASPNLDAVYRLVRDTDILSEADGPSLGEDMLDAVATICAAMTLAGRLEPLDERRNGILINMAAEYVRQTLDPMEEDVSVIIETVVEGLEHMHPEVDVFLSYAAGEESDDDAARVRFEMDHADPTPPPKQDEIVVPTAILIETEETEEVDVSALRHRIGAFFHIQPDSFRAFAQGDVYWRLALDGHNGYSGTLGGLKTVSEIAGVARASVVYRSEKGLGVTTITRGSKPVHRLIEQA